MEDLRVYGAFARAVAGHGEGRGSEEGRDTHLLHVVHVIDTERTEAHEIMTARVGRRARRSRVGARPRVRARARVRARWNLDAVPVSTEILGRAERHKGGEAEQDPTRSLHLHFSRLLLWLHPRMEAGEVECIKSFVIVVNVKAKI